MNIKPARQGYTTTGRLVPFIVEYVQESTTGLIVQFDGRELYYARLDFVSYVTPKLMAVVGANLAGNVRCGLAKENHRDYYKQPLKYHFDVDTKNLLRSSIRKIQAMETSRITMSHHSFITYNELYALADKLTNSMDDRRRALAVSLMVDKSETLGINNRVSTVTHAVYMLVAPIFAMEFLTKIIAKCESSEEYERELKFESICAKQLQTLFRDDLASIFELVVLKNRVYEPVDWNKEKMNRMKPNTVPIASEEVYRIAKDIFEDGKKQGHKAVSIKWKDYWARRWSSMPMGSVVSQYEDDRRTKRGIPRDARVKAAWFAANGMDKYSDWERRHPMIYASTSTKYEWGKVRALYGCDVTSFLHSDFAMNNCEDTLPSYFPVGSRGTGEYVKKIISTFQDGVPLCYDFDDFNSQHSTSSMTAVVDAWSSVHSDSLSEEQRRSLRWTSESISEQRVNFNEIGETVLINGTLLSGWRLTSFINTVLNRVYLVKSGLVKNTNYALHNGDDVFATTPTVMHAMEIVKSAETQGVRAQLAKTNIGTIGEFLRVDTRATNPLGSQYLARSVSTAVHGRIEMAPPNDYRAIVESFTVRFNEMCDRGADPQKTDQIKRAAFSFIARLFDQDELVTNKLLTTHPLQGGCCKEADISKHKVVLKEEDSDNMDTRGYEMLRVGINDYANYVVEKLGIEFDVPDRKQMFKQMVRSLQKPRKQYKIVIDTDERAMIYRGLYKAWSDGKHVSQIAMARSIGGVASKQLPGIDAAVARLIVQSDNPVRMMSAIL